MSLFAVFPLLLFALAAIAAPVLTGIIVYRDAKSRAMDAILWSLVAALAPGFIGLIIYLVVRSSHKSLVCAHCGAPVSEDFIACPQCASALKYHCDACGKAVDAEWRVCAYCGAPLPEGRPANVLTPAQGASGTGLWVLLVCLVAVPVLLILTVFFFSIV